MIVTWEFFLSELHIISSNVQFIFLSELHIKYTNVQLGYFMCDSCMTVILNVVFHDRDLRIFFRWIAR